MADNEFVDLSGDKGVLKKVLTPAKLVDQPKEGQQVFVHYTGKLDDGTVFDSSVNRGTPFNFTLGEGNVIKGWDICVKTMSVGEKCLVIIQPEYGYGDKGAGALIPPNSVLNFEIEFIMYREVSSKKKWEMSVDECIQAAQNSKIRGNEYFQKGNYAISIIFYQEAIDYLSGREEWEPAQQTSSASLLAACHLNLANCYIKTEEFSKAIESSTEALKAEKSVKAYYRRGFARMKFGFLQEAHDDLNQALVLDPNNKEARSLLAQINQLLKESEKKEKAVFSKMFAKSSIYYEKKPARDLGVLPKVFMEIKVNDKVFKIIIVLFDDKVPLAVKNFIGLCQGDHEDKRLNYKGSRFHKLVPGVLLEGGDVINGDGTGGMSIFGETFIDESFDDQFSVKGLIGMSNTGPNSNLSQFFITLSPQPGFNGKNIVVGKIIEGLELLDELLTVEVVDEKPKVSQTYLVFDRNSQLRSNKVIVVRTL